MMRYKSENQQGRLPLLRALRGDLPRGVSYGRWRPRRGGRGRRPQRGRGVGEGMSGKLPRFGDRSRI